MTTPSTTEKPTLSLLPPAWGGLFVWLRNDVGNLTLVAVDVFTGDDKDEIVREIKGAL